MPNPLFVPAQTPGAEKLQRVVQRELKDRADEILARPGAKNSLGMFNPRVVSLDEARIVAQAYPNVPTQQGRQAISPFQAVGNLGRALPSVVEQFYPGESGQQFRATETQFGPLEAARQFQAPSVQIPGAQQAQGFVRSGVKTMLTNVPGRDIAANVAANLIPTQLGIKGAIEGATNPLSYAPGIGVVPQVKASIEAAGRALPEALVRTPIRPVQEAGLRLVGAKGVAGGAVSPSGDELPRIQQMLQTKQKTPTDWNDLALKAQEYANDSYYGVRRLQGQIQKMSPIIPGSSRDVITGITRAPGAPNAGLTRYENAVAEMKAIAPNANVTDISTVLFAEHGKEILAAKGPKRVLPGGINTPEGLDNALRDLETRLGTPAYQQVQAAADVVKNLYATERERLVASGLISKDLGDALAQQYPWYNPLRYLDYAEAEANAGRSVRPISVSASGLRRLSEVGSEKAIVDPMATLSQELIRNEVRIQKNDLAKAIVNLGLEDKNLAITKRKITVPVAQVEGQPIFRPQHGEIPGTMSFMENGKRQVYDVPDWMYRETAVLHQSLRNPVASLIGGLNGISRAAFTSVSPVFTVANMFNDMLPALVRGGVFPTDTARRLALSFRSLESDPLMQAYRLAGGYQGRFYGRDAEAIAKQVGVSGGKVIGKNFNLKAAVLNAIPALGEKGEQASRQAVFEKNLTKSLPSWKTMTPEQIAATPEARKAAADAVEATINFGRGGYLIRAANPLVIFLNAGMEGTKLPFRTLRDSPRARWMLAGLGAGITGLAAYNMSYPEYMDVPDRVRWGSLVIMLPSTKTDLQGKSVPKYLTIIPNTREWASFFAPVIYGMEKAFRDSPEGFLHLAGSLIPQVSPIGNIPLPPVLGEVAQQMANYDFYTGNPIVSQGKQNLPPSEQTGPYVSPAVEKTAQEAGQSPLRWQHALQALFGGAGSAITSVLDLAVGAKNQHGFDLKAQYDALPAAQKRRWLDKLSSADRTALTAATNQAQRTIPLVSPIAGRFFHERGGQLEQNDFAALDKATKKMQQDFQNIKGMTSLGIHPGQVGDSIGNTRLTTAQRAQYQQLTGQYIVANVGDLVQVPAYIQATEDIKKRMVTMQMDIARERARGIMRQQLLKGQSKFTINAPTAKFTISPQPTPAR